MAPQFEEENIKAALPMVCYAFKTVHRAWIKQHCPALIDAWYSTEDLIKALDQYIDEQMSNGRLFTDVWDQLLKEAQALA